MTDLQRLVQESWTLGEAAKLAGYNKDYFRKIVRGDDAPAFFVYKRSYRFPKREFHQWMTKRLRRVGNIPD